MAISAVGSGGILAQLQAMLGTIQGQIDAARQNGDPLLALLALQKIVEKLINIVEDGIEPHELDSISKLGQQLQDNGLSSRNLTEKLKKLVVDIFVKYQQDQGENDQDIINRLSGLGIQGGNQLMSPGGELQNNQATENAMQALSKIIDSYDSEFKDGPAKTLRVEAVSQILGVFTNDMLNGLFDVIHSKVGLFENDDAIEFAAGAGTGGFGGNPKPFFEDSTFVISDQVTRMSVSDANTAQFLGNQPNSPSTFY